MKIFKLRTPFNHKTSAVLSMNMSHWSKLPLAPPDKILGLNEMFNKSTNPSKVNLGVGAYRDDTGKPLILESVKKAKEAISKSNSNHEYAGIAGVLSYVDLSTKFAYGENSSVIKNGQVAAVQTLSGTGACRLFGEFIARFYGRGTKVYLPDPTWGNHIAIMKNSGLEPVMYNYYNPATNGVDFKGFVDDVKKAEDGSVFLIHACAHNPTGCDPSSAQWDELSKIFKSKNHVVFFDCAYQGFASGDSEKDAYAVRKFVEDGHHIILAQSFAKNFGLYGERIGTLSVVTSSAEEAARVKSQLLLLIRPMYSNPPLYGARIVGEVLATPALKAQWTIDCKNMADRIIKMRQLLRDELQSVGSTRDWKHITEQIGMFCYSGLTTPQVMRLRNEFDIFSTEDGRFSMAGINAGNVKYIAKAIHTVTST